MTDERTQGLLAWLGKLVTVTVDAAPATDAVTPTGFVRTASGADLHAYLVGVSHPGRTFTGKVVAAVRRTDHAPDSLVVAPVGAEWYEPWIRRAVFPAAPMEGARIFCLYEKSCGAIPYRIRDGHLEYLALFQSGSATWSFPKGHVEWGEEELDTARREVREEIGVALDIPADFRCEIFYSVHNKRSRKRVVLYAVPFDGEYRLRETEIRSAKWMRRGEVQRLFGHKELYAIFNRLEKKVGCRTRRSHKPRKPVVKPAEGGS